MQSSSWNRTTNGNEGLMPMSKMQLNIYFPPAPLVPTTPRAAFALFCCWALAGLNRFPPRPRCSRGAHLRQSQSLPDSPAISPNAPNEKSNDWLGSNERNRQLDDPRPARVVVPVDGVWLGLSAAGMALGRGQHRFATALEDHVLHDVGHLTQSREEGAPKRR